MCSNVKLYFQLLTTYNQREAGIKECITITIRRVRKLSEDKESGNNVLKELRKEQNKVRRHLFNIHLCNPCTPNKQEMNHNVFVYS